MAVVVGTTMGEGLPASEMIAGHIQGQPNDAAQRALATHLASHVSSTLGLSGPVCVISGACSR